MGALGVSARRSPSAPESSRRASSGVRWAQEVLGSIPRLGSDTVTEFSLLLGFLSRSLEF